MLKVKMLTFHNAENYGATLQAYALKETLKKLGTAPSFVNYENKAILADYKLIRTNSLKSFFSSLWYLPRNLKRKISFKSFSDTYLDAKSKSYASASQIEKDIEDGDVFVAGSDQIWNPELTDGLSDVYTLNFETDKVIKRVIYGASLGSEEILQKHADEFKAKTHRLDYVSVREQSIIESLSNICGKGIEQVVDPTLLLNKSDWDNFITNNTTVSLKSQKYILVYTLFESDEVTKIANCISKITGLKVVHFRKYNAYNNEYMNLYSKGPIDFVNAFKNAEYIVTNSFHGTVFSIIYEKCFYSVLPKSRAGRIKDLLDKLNLNSRIVEKAEDIKLEENIDYTYAKEKIEEMRIHSIEYLKKGVL